LEIGEKEEKKQQILRLSPSPPFVVCLFCCVCYFRVLTREISTQKKLALKEKWRQMKKIHDKEESVKYGQSEIEN